MNRANRMDITNNAKIKFSSNHEEDVCTEITIKSEFLGFESVDVKENLINQSKVTNPEDNKDNLTNNPAINLKTAVIKLEKLSWCEKCRQEFKNVQNLNSHVCIHTKKKRKIIRKNKDPIPDKCPVCAKEFTKSNSLKVHIFRHHSEVKPFECEVCKKCFLTKYDLDTHMYMHDNKKSFVCDVCSKAFRMVSYLNNHKKIHLEKRPYNCKTCGKGFMKRFFLNIHTRHHTGETPFECDICKKKFTNRNTLRMHIDTHVEGGGPHKCLVCGKGFVRTSRLKAHLPIHSGIKSYVCQICEKAFSRKDSLTAHMAIHESKQSFACESCGKHFCARKKLKNHMRCHKSKKDGLKPDFVTIYLESDHKVDNQFDHISVNEKEEVSIVKTEFTSEIVNSLSSVKYKFSGTFDAGFEIDVEDVKIEVDDKRNLIH